MVGGGRSVEKWAVRQYQMSSCWTHGRVGWTQVVPVARSIERVMVKPCTIDISLNKSDYEPLALSIQAVLGSHYQSPACHCCTNPSRTNPTGHVIPSSKQ